MAEHATRFGGNRGTEQDVYQQDAAEVPGPRTDSGAPDAMAVDAQVTDPAPGRSTADTGHGAWQLGPRGMDPEAVRKRWSEAQNRFVDDPHQAVRELDALAAEVTDAVVAEIESRRSALRAAWNDDRGTDTEALRLALRDYRSFVEHLVGGTA
ncbi:MULTISPECIES: hypothetical protein [unclassified Nocardiopsis]|uniref:hypothetical protein n=1 Tax=unclassified Nocardiopsis TaxID=2649073 RepID=UPI001F5B7D5A|nr:hypothetical protein [Nocardiopsis sp. TSRI0078]